MLRVDQVTVHKLIKVDTDDPAYEVEAPDGFQFKGCYGHFFTAIDMKHVRDELATLELVPCPPDCDCRA